LIGQLLLGSSNSPDRQFLSIIISIARISLPATIRTLPIFIPIISISSRFLSLRIWRFGGLVRAGTFWGLRFNSRLWNSWGFCHFLLGFLKFPRFSWIFEGSGKNSKVHDCFAYFNDFLKNLDHETIKI
jgi:hypothetical protein